MRGQPCSFQNKQEATPHQDLRGTRWLIVTTLILR